MKINRYTTASPSLKRALAAQQASKAPREHLGEFKQFDLYVDQFAVCAIDPDNKVAGVLVLLPIGSSARVSTNVVLQEHVGQGLGSALYEAALDYHGSLLSSTTMSVGALKAWHKLCIKHLGKVKIPQLGGSQLLNIEGWVDVQGAKVATVRYKDKVVPVTKIADAYYIIAK